MLLLITISVALIVFTSYKIWKDSQEGKKRQAELDALALSEKSKLRKKTK